MQVTQEQHSVKKENVLPFQSTTNLKILSKNKEYRRQEFLSFKEESMDWTWLAQLVILVIKPFQDLHSINNPSLACLT